MKKILSALLPTLPRDAAGVVGAGLVAYGVGAMYRPAGFIVAGVMLIAVALLISRAE